MKTKLKSCTYAILPKESKIRICNPKWNDDKPKTQFYMELQVKDDVSIEVLGGTYTAKITKIFAK